MKILDDLEDIRATLEIVDQLKIVAQALLDNHEEAHGSCEDCLADGRGTHAEQLQTLLDKLKC